MYSTYGKVDFSTKYKEAKEKGSKVKYGLLDYIFCIALSIYWCLLFIFFVLNNRQKEKNNLKRVV